MDNQDMLFVLLKGKKEDIIDLWSENIEELYPSLYNMDHLKENGAIYFELLTDYHIPLEEHECFDIVSRICLYHAQRNTPVDHILHSSHVWRKSILSVIMEFFKDKEHFFNEMAREVCTIQERVDQLQRIISTAYLDYSQQLIHQRDEEINELHTDRLNILGKMAANMAHEIRNPLTAIEGFLKLIRLELADSTPPKVEGYLGIIDQELEGLYRQVTSFLSFSKNNGIEETYVFHESNELIHSALDLMKPRFIDDKIAVNLSLEASHTLTIQKTAIQQVLTNLINNAIDALQEVQSQKIIKILTYQDEEKFYISVTDNGIGIPDELKEKIFDPFVTGKHNGTGLGLSICKQIMGKNHGDIFFTSGGGETTFTLSISKSIHLNQVVG